MLDIPIAMQHKTTHLDTGGALQNFSMMSDMFADDNLEDKVEVLEAEEY